MIYYVIPARSGSKGFPRKNKILFPYTWNTFDYEMRQSCILSTDDMSIIPDDFTGVLHKRSDKNANDKASMKNVAIEIIIDLQLNIDDILVFCYLTYPERTLVDIATALRFFQKQNLQSLLGCQEPKTHPYLCVYADGRQVVNHNLYRRQDYPDVYEISHFLCMFNVSQLHYLNDNLYNEHTFFYPVNRHIDVDIEADLLEAVR